MSANPDTKKCVGIKIVLARQGYFGQMCRHLAVGATCRRHVGNFLSQDGKGNCDELDGNGEIDGNGDGNGGVNGDRKGNGN